MSTAHDQELARAQSAELAAALGQPGNPGPRGDSYRVTTRQRRGSEPADIPGELVTNARPPTRNELTLLAALAVNPRQIWRPGLLIDMHPEVFGEGKHASGLHRTAHSAQRKGLVRRRKTNSRVGWQICPAGLAALAEHDEKALQ